jgi:hypothetical protein
MADNRDVQGPVGIRVVDAKNVVVKGNTVAGMPLLEATRVTGLKVEENHNEFEAPKRKVAWYARVAWQFWLIAAMIIAACIAAKIIQHFGWNK